MGFFDLNIPLPEPFSNTNKSTVESNRTRLAVKAMELGYTGIAYNRTIKGVMSDHHRCSISPLSLSSLLNIVPFLSSSAKLHRDLLGIPSSTPFRQYTRLTVCVDSPAQAQALNSGNPILKTYDLVAVKPLNQTAFDLACERMEVDIISIDFSNKLPFRLKQPMVKAATQRGVCFEVSYYGLLADVQMRRQLISSAKLLIDWTRGRNIIFSSAAPSVNELRGPCDVANLLSLFGLSKEQAKAAISKNCRTLLANSLRKKRFYKEAIKVEVLSSDVASHSKEAWHQELLKWDPISSGEGDILLDDMASSCSALHKASKKAKAINFLSVVNSLPSHGYKVQDFLPTNGALTVSPEKKVNFLPVTQKVNQSTRAPNDLTEQPNRLDICPDEDESLPPDGIKKENQSTPEPNNLTGQPNRLDICPNEDESIPPDGIKKHHTVSCGNLFEKNIHGGTAEVLNYKEDIYTQTNDTELELKNTIDPDVYFTSLEAKALDSLSGSCILSNALDTVKPHENEILVKSSNDQQNIDDKIFKMQEDLPKEDFEIARHTVLEINTSTIETSVEDGLFDKRELDAGEPDEMPQQTTFDEIKTEADSTVAMHLLPDLIMEDDKQLGEVSTGFDQLASVQSVSGRFRVKRRTPLLFPKNSLLNRMTFKKKGKKYKRRTNLK